MSDRVIQEIQDFFLTNNFEETDLRGYKNEKIFKYKDGFYYMISQGEKAGYYIEAASNKEEAKNRIFEDTERYPVPWGTIEIIDDIKKDIKKYILKNKINMTGETETTTFRYAT